MAKQVVADGYKFDFTDAVLDAYVFDSSKYNGVKNKMKSVDIVAEFPQEYLFIELKKYRPERGGMEFRCPLWDDKSLIISQCPLGTDDNKRVKATIKRISHDLRRKYFDTFLYFFAENKLGDKQVNYICVVEGCEAAQILRLNEILSSVIPQGIPAQSHWVRPIMNNLAVVNVEEWNEIDKINRYGRCSLI